MLLEYSSICYTDLCGRYRCRMVHDAIYDRRILAEAVSLSVHLEYIQGFTKGCTGKGLICSNGGGKETEVQKWRSPFLLQCRTLGLT